MVFVQVHRCLLFRKVVVKLADVSRMKRFLHTYSLDYHCYPRCIYYYLRFRVPDLARGGVNRSSTVRSMLSAVRINFTNHYPIDEMFFLGGFRLDFRNNCCC